MKSFEDEVASDSERMKVSTKLTVLACVLLVLVAVTVLGVHGRYIDVEQAVQVSGVAPTAVAIRDSTTTR